MQNFNFDMDDAINWVRFSSLRLPVHPKDVLNAFDTVTNFCDASIDQIKTLLGEKVFRVSWTKKIENMISQNAAVELIEYAIKFSSFPITYSNHCYPIQLKQISTPPPVLWCTGNLSAINNPLIAIVGSRQASDYGKRAASYFSKALVSSGIGIISGGALGIDAIAHNTAISNNGFTIAVKGTGIDISYPSVNKNLFENISRNGLCISEFLPKVQPRPENFPVRNRIISAMSLGVLVVEAQEKSGALITARYALEQNKEVFAVPGSIFEENAVGVNRLIQRGAKLVHSIEDLFDEIKNILPNGNALNNKNVHSIQNTTKVDHSTEQNTEKTTQISNKKSPISETIINSYRKLSDFEKIVYHCMDNEPQTIDSIQLTTQVQINKIQNALFELESSDLIELNHGQSYTQKVKSLF